MVAEASSMYILLESRLVNSCVTSPLPPGPASQTQATGLNAHWNYVVKKNLKQSKTISEWQASWRNTVRIHVAKFLTHFVCIVSCRSSACHIFYVLMMLYMKKHCTRLLWSRYIYIKLRSRNSLSPYSSYSIFQSFKILTDHQKWSFIPNSNRSLLVHSKRHDIKRNCGTDEFCPSHHLRINQIPLHKQSKSTVLAQESIRQNIALEETKASPLETSYFRLRLHLACSRTQAA